MQPLDYRPLQEPPQPKYLRAARETPSMKWTTNKWILGGVGGILLLVVVLAIIGLFTMLQGGRPLSEVSGLIVLIGIIILGSVLTLAIVRYIVRTRARLLRFAEVNQLELLFDQPARAYDGVMFLQGHDRTTPLLLRSPAGPHEIEIGNHRYVTGSGKTRSTHTKGYVRIRLPRRLPNMVLDARSNNAFGVVSNLPTGYKADQRLSLEGNFDSFFTLYAPAQYKTDALYVFTPDVMAVMIDYGKDYDIEIIDDELFLYANTAFDVANPHVLSGLFKIVATIQKEVIDQADNYRDDRVPNAQAFNAVAPAGQRLVKRPAYAATVLVIVMFALFQLPALHRYFWIIAGVVVAGPILYSWIRRINR